jgi:hypothetical protein
VGIVFLPFLGILLYLIVNGDHRRATVPARPAPVTDTTVQELEGLRELRGSGALSEDEYERAKARTLAD